MRWALVLFALLFVSPALADDSVTCVQQVLTNAGYDVGAVDGSFGSKTTDAGKAYLQKNALLPLPLPLPELSKTTTTWWCDMLGKPTFTLAELNMGTGVAPKRQQLIEDGLRHAQEFLINVVGVTPRKTVQVFASNDAKWLTDNYLKSTGLPAGFRKGKMESFGACNPPAEFAWYSLYLCTDAPEWDRGDAFSQGILAHEYFHDLQSDLVGTAVKGCCTDNDAMSAFGPEWLKEGSAQYTHLAMLDYLGLSNLRQDIKSLVRQYSSKSLDLLGRNTRKGYRDLDRDLSEDMGVVATYILVQKWGYTPLVNFYRLLGYGIKQDKAFALAFGETEEDFQTEFQTFSKSL